MVATRCNSVLHDIQAALEHSIYTKQPAVWLLLYKGLRSVDAGPWITRPKRSKWEP